MQGPPYEDLHNMGMGCRSRVSHTFVGHACCTPMSYIGAKECRSERGVAARRERKQGMCHETLTGMRRGGGLGGFARQEFCHWGCQASLPLHVALFSARFPNRSQHGDLVDKRRHMRQACRTLHNGTERARGCAILRQTLRRPRAALHSFNLLRMTSKQSGGEPAETVPRMAEPTHGCRRECTRRLRRVRQLGLRPSLMFLS